MKHDQHHKLLLTLVILLIGSAAYGKVHFNSPNDSINAVQTLIDSTKIYSFGSFCVSTGYPPEGKIAINTLTSVTNFNLIDSLFAISENT
jgi:hypothetical protein